MNYGGIGMDCPDCELVGLRSCGLISDKVIYQCKSCLKVFVIDKLDAQNIERLNHD